MDKAGKLVSTRQEIAYVPETRTRTVNIGGKDQVQTYTVAVPVMRKTERVWNLDKATFMEAGGKKIDKETLTKRLAKPTPVVISSDGRAVDPGYLQLFKKDTIVIVAAQQFAGKTPTAEVPS